jgi:hypothetical protein
MIPVSSLIEELRRSVEIDTDTENKVDELTVELLCKAGIRPRRSSCKRCSRAKAAALLIYLRGYKGPRLSPFAYRIRVNLA